MRAMAGNAAALYGFDLAGNAAALYGFDLDRLAPLAASHGPTVEQVATPLAEIPAKATSPAFFKP